MLTWRQVRQSRLDHALIDAVEKRETHKMVALLQQGANPNAPDEPQPEFWGNPTNVSNWWSWWEQFHKRQATVLMVAVESGNRESVRLLLDRGADPMARYQDGDTALHRACYIMAGTTIEVMGLLLAQGADVNARSIDGTTPLMDAALAQRGDLNVNVVRFLSDHGAEVNAGSADSALTIACAQNDDPKLVSLLLERGANVHYRTKTGETALTYAMAAKNTAIIHLLKRAGAK